MKLRKVLSLLLVCAMMMGITAFAAEEEPLLIAPAPAAFTDVEADSYYADAVSWAATKEITTGRGDGIFDPEATVTRAEAVTFLWRMAGEPEPTQTETFDDVVNDPNKVWYETAVQWAVEKGITNGTGSGFSPYVTCDRGMILTMIYRMEGKPWDEALAAETSEELSSLDDLGVALVKSMVESFRSRGILPDVKEGDYYEIPIIWSMMYLLDSKFTDAIGMTDENRAIQPTAPCVRGEMVYFLYQANAYEDAVKAAQESYDQWNTPPEPIEVGAIEKTVVMDKDGIKITADSIEYDEDSYDAVLHMTVENGSGKQICADTYSLYVNTYYVSSSASIPVEEDGWTSYESVIVPAGATREFEVSLNSLREKGITSVYEIEVMMGADEITITEDGYEYGEAHIGEYVTLKTSLYDEGVDYGQEGTVAYDKDGLKVLITKAENSEYNGPQITVYVYNGTEEEVNLELAVLTLDGEAYEFFYGNSVEPGKRSVDGVYIDYDYENVPTPKEATLTFRTVTYDDETWDPIPVITFDPVTVTFDAE